MAFASATAVLRPARRQDRAPRGRRSGSVGFTPDGSTLVVTDGARTPSRSTGFGLRGPTRAPNVEPSSGPTPYGFAFASNSTLVVTEAFRAEKGKAAASSYPGSAGDRRLRSPHRSGTAGEICWAVVSNDDRYAFTTNFADGTVSRYAIAPTAASRWTRPSPAPSKGRPGLRDQALSATGTSLYAIDTDTGRIFGWAVVDDDKLVPLGSREGVPASSPVSPRAELPARFSNHVSRARATWSRSSSFALSR